LSLTYHFFYCFIVIVLSHIHTVPSSYNRKKIRYATSPYSTARWLIWFIWYRSDEKMNRTKIIAFRCAFIDQIHTRTHINTNYREETIESLYLIPIWNSSLNKRRFFNIFLLCLLNKNENLSTLIKRMQSYEHLNSCLEISIIIKKKQLLVSISV